MHTYTFWREREARFLELAESREAVDLHATRVDVDLPALLDDSSRRTRQAINNPSATPDSVYHGARTTARAGHILLDGEQADKWILSGGPGNDVARTALQTALTIEAKIAAAGAGEAHAGMSEQALLEAWLDLIAGTKSPSWRHFPVLEDVARASAEMCNRLAAGAYIAAASRPERTTAAVVQQSRFPNRATFLQNRIDSGLSAYRIRGAGGPDKKTINRILEGKPVQRNTLEKLAMALRVSVGDIPND